MVFVMIARRKKLLSASALQTVESVYAIGIFDGCDQASNCPEGTCQNLAAQYVFDHVVLHIATFCNMPFVHDSFAFISSSLSLHNASTKDQKAGILECARVLIPGGMILVVDLFPRVTFYAKWLIKMGWIDVSTVWSGTKMICGVLPCQTMRAIKLLNSKI
jgi:ubiquinone/menaquinone biosynthesis C-methylase UbiE